MFSGILPLGEDRGSLSANEAFLRAIGTGNTLPKKVLSGLAASHSKWGMKRVMFSSVNTCWTLVGSVPCLLHAGGLRLVRSRFHRAKNTGNILMKNMMDFCIGTPCYWIIGFGLMFGSTGALIGGFDPFIQGDYSHLGLDIPLWVYIVFQTVFCATVRLHRFRLHGRAHQPGLRLFCCDLRWWSTHLRPLDGAAAVRRAWASLTLQAPRPVPQRGRRHTSLCWAHGCWVPSAKYDRTASLTPFPATTDRRLLWACSSCGSAGSASTAVLLLSLAPTRP